MTERRPPKKSKWPAGLPRAGGIKEKVRSVAMRLSGENQEQECSGQREGLMQRESHDWRSQRERLARWTGHGPVMKDLHWELCWTPVLQRPSRQTGQGSPGFPVSSFPRWKSHSLAPLRLGSATRQTLTSALWLRDQGQILPMPGHESPPLPRWLTLKTYLPRNKRQPGAAVMEDRWALARPGRNGLQGMFSEVTRVFLNRLW